MVGHTFAMHTFLGLLLSQAGKASDTTPITWEKLGAGAPVTTPQIAISSLTIVSKATAGWNICLTDPLSLNATPTTVVGHISEVLLNSIHLKSEESIAPKGNWCALGSALLWGGAIKTQFATIQEHISASAMGIPTTPRPCVRLTKKCVAANATPQAQDIVVAQRIITIQYGSPLGRTGSAALAVAHTVVSIGTVMHPWRSVSMRRTTTGAHTTLGLVVFGEIWAVARNGQVKSFHALSPDRKSVV